LIHECGFCDVWWCRGRVVKQHSRNNYVPFMMAIEMMCIIMTVFEFNIHVDLSHTSQALSPK
jgi:hypothetical protein